MEPIRIQKVVDHIEGHLTQELSGEDLAAMMAVSEADLQRSFKMITGWTMGEYIRCRRLSEAALDLKRGGKVLDAVLTYGYQTAESFSKAFKQYYGCTPAEARRADRPIRYFSPMVIKLAKRGGSVTERRDSRPEKAGSVAAYYDANDESGRLTGSRHGRMEYLITMEYLKEVLPSHGRVLDCCAGTGVYAFELAKDHRVVAGDLSEKNVDRMERLQESCPVLEEIHRLDACDLSRFGDGAFDGVLCMGPSITCPTGSAG